MAFDMDFVKAKYLFSKVPVKIYRNVIFYKMPFLRQNCVLTFIWTINKINEPRHEKTNVLVSDLVRHKSGCTATEDG